MPETTARFQLAPDVVTRQIDDGLLLVNLETGLTWKVNRVGAAICRRLDGAIEVAEIVAALEREYAVSTDVVRRDVDALLAELQKQGLVQPSGTE